MKHIFTVLLNHRVPIILLVGLLIVTGAWGFLALASEVLEGETMHFDEWIVHSLRQPENPALTRGPRWTVQAARDITALGSHAVLSLIAAVVIGLLLLQHKHREAVLILLTTSGGAALSTFLKMHYGRARPDIPHLVDVFSPSFPSGHAMLSAVFYLTLGTLLSRIEPKRRVRLYLLGVAMSLAFLIGLSRIYLGVHYPTDVLAGWTAGLVWALLCWSASRFFLRDRNESRSDDSRY